MSRCSVLDGLLLAAVVVEKQDRVQHVDLAAVDMERVLTVLCQGRVENAGDTAADMEPGAAMIGKTSAGQFVVGH